MDNPIDGDENVQSNVSNLLVDKELFLILMATILHHVANRNFLSHLSNPICTFPSEKR